MVEPTPGQESKPAGFIRVKEQDKSSKPTVADKPFHSGDADKKIPEATQLVQRLIDRLKAI
ncbi:MAG: hypothetical protein M1281_07880 [Chloroflexi bacterium]|nr:hypothetical protein [Chloroflexota bacterium]